MSIEDLPTAARTFYRVGRSDPPTLADVTSNRAAGRAPRRSTPDIERLWDGISVFDTEAGARRQAGMYPWLGRFIVELAIPARSVIQVERTTGTPGHYTLWGDPEALLAMVRSVVPL